MFWPTTFATTLRRRRRCLYLLPIVVGLAGFGFRQILSAPPQLVAGAVRLNSTLLNESSGLAFSKLDPTVIWTHNDSGDTARLFAFDAGTGQATGQCTLAGVDAEDWEALAVTAGGQLIVADSGDNGARRESVRLHRFDEPPPGQRSRIAADQIQTLAVRYPGGAADCEAIWVDEPTASVILVTKTRLAAAAVWSVPLAAFDAPGKTAEAIKVADLVLPMVTGGDVDPASGHVWLTTYWQAFRFSKTAGGNLTQQMSSVPRAYPLPPWRQVEAIAVDGSSGVWVTTEGEPALAKLEFVDD